MCFGLDWLEHLFILIIIVCVILALLKLLISFIAPRAGMGGEVLAFVVQAATIIIWGVVCIAAVVFVFELFACLIPMLSFSGRAR
jgi:hypothetical protein